MKKKYVFISLGVCVLLALAMVGPVMSRVEHPKYTVISKSQDIEIREYAPMLVAEVLVEGTEESSMGAGFRMLADYIFGNNVSKESIKMTAPVVQEKGEKIPMTAPVTQEKKGDFWRVRFVMPAKYTLETLPRPVNQKVHIRSVPAQKYVAIRFSGKRSRENLGRHEKKLLDHVRFANLKVHGNPQYAFYNPPWTLPFLRRNEILIELLA